jgi:hypothetical protein
MNDNPYPDPFADAARGSQPTLRSFSLILARCGSAATLLTWRDHITPEQKRHLDAAILRLQEAAARVAVCEPKPATPGSTRARYDRSHRARRV